MDGSAARDNLEIAGRDSYIVSFIGAVYLLVNCSRPTLSIVTPLYTPVHSAAAYKLKKMNFQNKTKWNENENCREQKHYETMV